MDDEILKTVHSIFGKSVQIVDCEKTSSVRQEEVLLINGIPVTLDGHNGDAIKSALLGGQVPSVELLNQLLFQAGILKQPVQLETSLSVQSSMVTTEEVSVARGGRILDGHTSETKEDYVYSSSKKEIWEPVIEKTVHEREKMAYTPRFRLVEQTNKSQSSDTAAVNSAARGEVPNEHIPSCSSVNAAKIVETPSTATFGITRSATTATIDSSGHNFYYGSGMGEDRNPIVVGQGTGNKDDEDDEDEEDDDDDEDGELYLLNTPQTARSYCPYQKPSSPLTNRLPLTRSTTHTISASAGNEYSHDELISKYPKDITLSKSSVASTSGKKSSLLSYDSGHDGVFHSQSQQTGTSNIAPLPLQQSTANNTDHSISSCYDFISSDEADFLTTTNNSKSNLGKQCKTVFASKERSYAELLHREQTQPSKPPNDNKNVKSPNLGKKTSMSSSSCAPTNSTSSQQKQQQQQPQQQQPRPSHHQQQKISLQHASAIGSNVNDCALLNSSFSSSSSVDAASQAVVSSTSVENDLVFRDGNLISGPLDALIVHMVPTSQYYPDESFIFSFLLSARLFIRPHELLAKISETWERLHQQQCPMMAPSVDVVDERCTHPTNVSSGGRMHQMYPPQYADEQTRQKATKSAQNCVKLLAEWIDTFPYDFRDERLMQHVRILARKCVYIDTSLGKIVSNILQNLVQRLTILEKYEEFLQTLTANESNETITTTEDLIAHHRLFSSSLLSSSSSSSAGGGHTNSGYVHAAGSISSNDGDDPNTTTMITDSSNVSVSSTAAPVGSMPHKSSLSSSYTSNTGASHYPHQSVYHHHHHHHHHHNSHQSDSSSNSGNILGPGGGSISIGGCTSSGAVNNGAELIGICDLCPNAALLAHQLTHIELERLSHIGPEEFVQAFAKENQLETFSDMKKTRNLESYVQWFNRLSYFTATEIVKYPKKKQRVRVIEFWIETARECFNIGNFNSLMAIIAGLNLSPISRLKKTWSKIQSAKFSVLEHQMDPTSNFNSYRSTLKAAMWRSEGATNETERIIIPFFSLLVKDLYFLNEGCSNRLPNGHINFEKFWQLAKQVMEFNTWKKVVCPFKKLPKVITFLHMSPVLNESTLSMASFECEPPENNQEKGRYKTLKSETKQQQQQQQQQHQQT